MEVTFEQFKAWLDNKNPSETFDATDYRACMGFQFLTDIGANPEACGVRFWYTVGNTYRFPEAIDKVITWAFMHKSRLNLSFGEVQKYLEGK